MPLTKASMSTSIKTEIEGLYGTPDDPSLLQKFCDALAKAIVENIQANALVSTTGTVTSGAGAGGGVTSTGTVS